MKILLISVVVIAVFTFLYAQRFYGKDKAIEENAGVDESDAGVVKTVDMVGFDPEGDPEIRIMSDGSMYVVFNFMPPSYTDEDDELAARFDDFDKQIEAAVGVPVIWEDREFFLIQKPAADTVEKIKSFVESYRESL